ncbi:MAG: hypothetical protein KatS3mg068_0433 [Candidatus Sericytochromatia bacterium]|nr:MAG: hypothetical protein KatS3mg068_0433 [Candidatus Sericytochromatia bacterium]
MIPFLFELEGTTSVSARIKKVELNKKDFLNIDFQTIVQNKGDSNLEGIVFISILDENYNFITKLQSKKKTIYPYQECSFNNSIKYYFPKGNYHAIITFVYKDKSVSIDKPFEISK